MLFPPNVAVIEHGRLEPLEVPVPGDASAPVPQRRHLGFIHWLESPRDRQILLETKSTVNPGGSGSGALDEYDRKNLELGEAMEHEHGQDREQTEQDVEATAV
jgi:hypothetical protein